MAALPQAVPADIPTPQAVTECQLGQPAAEPPSSFLHNGLIKPWNLMRLKGEEPTHQPQSSKPIEPHISSGRPPYGKETL